MKENLGNTPKKLPYYYRKVNTHKEIFDILSINFDREKIKNFIIRKKEYLDKNRVMDDDKFIELFWWTWKYNKSEIRQDNHLWLCYAYTGFEILKKSNFFKELIQTNFREIWEWKREIRIPFCDTSGYRIKVNKNEIFDENWKDREYSFIPRGSKAQKEKTVKITSWSSLWFKILEIAFIKSYIVFNPTYSSDVKDVSSMNARWQFNLAWDFKIKEWHLIALEIWNIWNFIQHLFWSTIVKYNNPDEDNSGDIDCSEVIDGFNSGFIKVALYLKDDNTRFFNDDSTIKIFNTKNQPISNCNKTSDWRKIRIVPGHLYSVEKFYNTINWEKRVKIVNPWDTTEKIDMPMETCIDIFKRRIIWFDIDKMFENKKEES